MRDLDGTIAAIATPLGEGGVAIVRISGRKAIAIAACIFSGPVANYKSHTAHYGQIHDEKGNAVDDALLLVMRGPNSYTGEDTVEIQGHGGSLVSRRVLETVISAGARLAGPGEFTFRAYVNGRIDLAQAEAVQELICAKNELALHAAENQLKGALSQKIETFQEELIAIAAILEAWVDFPEEGLEFASMEEILAQLNGVLRMMKTLSATFHDGRILHEGLSLCLAGTPNVGKSSLMNALAKRERAIVTEIPGTTRDLLEEQIRINGLNLRLIDTAGIRTTTEIVEREGIKRSQEAISSSDLVLLVLDCSRPLSSEDKQLISSLPQEKTIAVWNKADLPYLDLPSLNTQETVIVSAKQSSGLQELKEAIDRIIWKQGPPSKEEVLLTKARHKEALDRSIDAVSQVIQGLVQGTSPEFLMLEMRKALQELGHIIGSDITEDILNAIFSRFCIGK